MAKVATKAGVSKATVSRALGGSMLIGEDVRSHVEMVANELGYVKRSQKRHAERSILTIKLVLPPAKDRSTQLFYNFMTLADGLRDGLAPSVANLIVETSSENYRPFPHKKGGEVDGFVFAFHRPPNRVVSEIQERGAACVILNRLVSGVRHVVSDHHNAMQQLAAHLAQRGVKGDGCYGYYGGCGFCGCFGCCGCCGSWCWMLWLLWLCVCVRVRVAAVAAVTAVVVAGLAVNFAAVA